MQADFLGLDKIINRWWLALAGLLVGALIGLAAHTFVPVIYEASAEISVNLDFTRTGTLTDVEQDQALILIGDLLRSTALREKVTAAAAAEGITLTPQEFDQAASADRYAFRWTLRVRDQDTARAEKLANLWAQEGMLFLTDSSLAAFRAAQIRNYLTSLEFCFTQTTAQPVGGAACPFTSLEQVRAEITSAQQQYQVEMIAAQGMMPYVDITWSRQAEGTSRAALFSRGSLVFAGGMLGLVLGLLLARTAPLPRLVRKNRAAKSD